MADQAGARGYDSSKKMLAVSGLAVLAVIVAFEVYRGIDPIEVAATTMFVPVLLAFIWKGLGGGLIAGSIATLVYLGIRLPSMQAVPEGWFIRATVARALAFLVFGAVGGWASRRLSSSLEKLELYDQIDDATGLYNARYFLQELEVEIARVRRYGSKLSVVTLEVPASEGSAQKRFLKVLNEYASSLKRSLRPTDRAAHGSIQGKHVFSVILPDTDASGAQVFAGRLKSAATEFFTKRGVESTQVALSTGVLAYPDDELELERLSEEMREIDRAEHPSQIDVGV